MEELKQTIRSLMKMEDVPPEHLEIVPDLSSEETLSAMLEFFAELYNDHMPFNKHLGIHVAELSMDEAVIKINSREELYGNYFQKILHGGVISSVIDLSGGIIAQVSSIKKMSGMSIAGIMICLSKMSTINMKVDFLRPGAGELFTCRASVLKSGNKVAATRMDMFDSNDELVATGTGAYLIG